MKIHDKKLNVKIFREENHGLMNIIPCYIFIYNEYMELINYDLYVFNLDNINQNDRIENNHFILAGGEIALLELEAGNYKIKILTPKSSQMKYLGHIDKDWESVLYNFEIILDKNMSLKILPGGDNGYNGTWIMEY